MVRLLKASVVWQFAGGFVLGAVGLLALHPGDRDLQPSAPTAVHAARQ